MIRAPLSIAAGLAKWSGPEVIQAAHASVEVTHLEGIGANISDVI